MSVVSCLLSLLLCLSLHACNARGLAAMDQKFQNQNDEKKVRVTMPMESSSNEPIGAAKENGISETHHLNGYGYTQEHKAKKKLMAGKNAKKSGSAGKRSLVSVPWRVPRNKRGAKHPGFNLDYSPPKTHPPSHN